MNNNAATHWRDSARSVRFFLWDGKAAFPLVAVLIWPRLWTLIMALVAAMFFTLLNRYGYSPMVFVRYVRSLFSGKRVHAIPWWDK